MKKIWAVSMVKNEEDIIESFCRYVLMFCDGLLIMDDNSIDNTGKIIAQLIKEGLQVEFYTRPFNFANDYGKQHQYDVYNELAHKAFDEYNADWVIPLDADEFLFCPDYSDPRAVIEELDESVEYRIYSRNYIFDGFPCDPSVFLPYQFGTFLRYPKEGRMSKTILSRKLYIDRGAKISIGHHRLEFDVKPYPKTEFTDKLLSAHYPFRSVEQMLAKVIIGELNYKASFNRDSCGLHYNIMYDAIKKFKSADPALVRRFCLFYSGIFETDIDSHEPVEIEQFSTPFLKEPISLKFTYPQPDQYAYLQKILACMESIIADFKKTITDYEQAKEALTARCKQADSAEKFTA